MIGSRRACLGLALLTALALPIGTAHASVVFHTFATPNGVNAGSNSPIGFAYAGNKFVGSYYFTDGSGFTGLYSTDLTGGNVQAFGTSVFIPTGIPEEHYVASSIGHGGFANRDIYVGANGSIYHISNDGTTGGLFVTGLAGIVRGIVFDAVGTFGGDMLVTTTSGTVYRVNSGGVATVLASVGEDTEGVDVAPIGAFGPYSGQLIVGSEGSGSIRAISSTGVITFLAHVDSAEEVDFVPLNLGASGNPVEGFYGADYPVQVIKADANQFNGMQGDLLVTGESTHQVSKVHFDGTNFTTSNIGTFPNQPEDGIFVTADIIGTPEPSSILLLLTGGAGLGFSAWRRRRLA